MQLLQINEVIVKNLLSLLVYSWDKNAEIRMPDLSLVSMRPSLLFYWYLPEKCQELIFWKLMNLEHCTLDGYNDVTLTYLEKIKTFQCSFHRRADIWFYIALYITLKILFLKSFENFLVIFSLYVLA